MDIFTYFTDGCPTVYDYFNLYMSDEEIKRFKKENKELLEKYDNVYESCKSDYNFSKELNNLNLKLKSELEKFLSFDVATREQRLDFKKFEKENKGKIFAVSTEYFKLFLNNKENLGNNYTLVKYLGRGKAREYYSGKIIYINSLELRTFINSLKDNLLISSDSTEKGINPELPLDKEKTLYDIYENDNELYPIFCDYSCLKNVEDITKDEKRKVILELSNNADKVIEIGEKLNICMQRIKNYFFEVVSHDIYNKEINMYNEAYVENMIYNMKNDLGNRPVKFVYKKNDI